VLLTGIQHASIVEEKNCKPTESATELHVTAQLYTQAGLQGQDMGAHSYEPTLSSCDSRTIWDSCPFAPWQSTPFQFNVS